MFGLFFELNNEYLTSNPNKSNLVIPIKNYYFTYENQCILVAKRFKVN
jgi:hypothetical protein